MRGKKDISIAMPFYCKKNWQIGHSIIEDEQQGYAKAVYGKAILKKLSSTTYN